ncbi:hypothetical protein RFI_31234 [Reticulomyxa filosa]|uniref:Uncharacterized protein n=1 Tax=Reticulomyxa filosa TaxID=46433 RepID=X6LX09_RETFI|nr:hypothetical protein RFI_31234 [Reticulomyxa filosa]|eukprot:ETO06164.1 hypothetical protein RFI_31234 [Reticulomyxa filosa]
MKKNPLIGLCIKKSKAQTNKRKKTMNLKKRMSFEATCVHRDTSSEISMKENKEKWSKATIYPKQCEQKQELNTEPTVEMGEGREEEKKKKYDTTKVSFSSEKKICSQHIFMFESLLQNRALLFP